MITPAYCQMMARYNAWQNKGIIGIFQSMGLDELTKDRGAFFGSIAATASHLYWGDELWISRFDGGTKPDCGIKDSVSYISVPDDWVTARAGLDQRILDWAANVTQSDLSGDFTWVSGAMGREVSKPLDMCIVHFFNHQTHHRGQLHAMFTASGHTPDDTDLFFMQEPAQ